jgi:hypothetical protein
MEHLLAQAPTWSALQKASPTDVADVATIGSLTTLVSNIIRALVMFSGVVLFVMLLSGGMSFLFSGGDQKKLEKAKGTITNAFIGLVVLVGSYLILRLIKTITGVDVTTFGLQITP